MIQRFSVDHKPRKDAEGDYVLYADHLVEMESEQHQYMTVLESQREEHRISLKAAVKKKDKTIQEGCQIIAEGLKVVEGLEGLIAALQERERILIGRLQAHGDIETDWEEALRGDE